MNPEIYLNAVFGTVSILAIVLIDYIRKQDTDKTRRRLFLIALCALLFAILADYAIVLLDPIPPQTSHFRYTGFLWILFTAAVVYIYFNIISLDQKTDALTGIGNRYSFNEFIGKLSVRKTSQKFFRESWAVVLIDMDHLKKINDTFGHPEGDNALKDLAKIIKGCIRRSDFAARYGGDEFVLAARAQSNIERLIERLRTELERHNNTAGRPYNLKISYGYDIFDTGGLRTIDEFFEHIDTLMYTHKARNRRLSDRIEI